MRTFLKESVLGLRCKKLTINIFISSSSFGVGGNVRFVKD